MRSRRVRAAGAACVVGLLAGACGGGNEDAEIADAMTSDSTTTTAASQPETTVIEVRLVGGSPEGGVRRESVEIGERVTLRVVADTADEVHVHGYDLEFAVGEGRPREVVFDATIPGVFDVELHGSGREILKLQVG